MASADAGQTGAGAPAAPAPGQASVAGPNVPLGPATPLGPHSNGGFLIVRSGDEGPYVRQNDQRAPAGYKNYSVNTVIHPSLLIDPGPGFDLFFVIIVGSPPGIITDIMQLLELVRTQRGLTYKIFGSFPEARTYYETCYDNNEVHFGQLLDTPLPFLLPGHEGNPISVASTAPTPAIERVARQPTVIPQGNKGTRTGTQVAKDDHTGMSTGRAATNALPVSPTPLQPSKAASGVQPKKIIEIPDGSSDSASSDEEMDLSDEVEFVDDENDPRLAHLPSYPKGTGLAVPVLAPAAVIVPSASGKAASARAASARAASAPAVPRAARLPPTAATAANPVTTTVDSRGIFSINPVYTGTPLGRDADPSKAFSHPDVNPDLSGAALPSKYRLVSYTPALYPPGSSKKRQERSFDQGAPPDETAAANNDGKKRRRAAIAAAFASSLPQAEPGPSASTSAPPPSGTLAGGSASSALASPSTTTPHGNAGQPNSSSDPFNSDTDWGFKEWTNEELDTSPAFATKKDKKGKGKVVKSRKPRGGA